MSDKRLLCGLDTRSARYVSFGKKTIRRFDSAPSHSSFRFNDLRRKPVESKGYWPFICSLSVSMSSVAIITHLHMKSTRIHRPVGPNLKSGEDSNNLHPC
jgi:hypothetical protein